MDELTRKIIGSAGMVAFLIAVIFWILPIRFEGPHAKLKTLIGDGLTFAIGCTLIYYMAW